MSSSSSSSSRTFVVAASSSSSPQEGPPSSSSSSPSSLPWSTVCMLVDLSHREYQRGKQARENRPTLAPCHHQKQDRHSKTEPPIDCWWDASHRPIQSRRRRHRAVAANGIVQLFPPPLRPRAFIAACQSIVERSSTASRYIGSCLQCGGMKLGRVKICTLARVQIDF